MNDTVCSRFHAAVELIGGRWTGAILQAMVGGRHRYAEIRASIPGISDAMLAQRLRSLEAEGVVMRSVLDTSPVHVEYHLTDKGRELGPVLDAVTAWAHRWMESTDEMVSPATPKRTNKGNRTQ